MRTALLSAVLVGLGSACSTPAPRIPFRDTAWHASVFGAQWDVNTFVKEVDAVGLELLFDEPGTSGWAFEMGARYGKGDSDGRRNTFNEASDKFDIPVDSEREIDFYEISGGVRQIYKASEILQPYFGIGGVFLYARSVERWVQPAQTPDGAAPDFPVDTPQSDHERTEIYPGIYARTGLVWNVLRDQIRDETEVPIALDVRGVLSVDYSYLEFSLGFGFGR